MSYEQKLIYAILSNPSIEKLQRLGYQDLLVFGQTGDVKIIEENNEIVYYYRGPYSDEFKKV